MDGARLRARPCLPPRRSKTYIPTRRARDTIVLVTHNRQQAAAALQRNNRVFINGKMVDFGLHP